MQLRFPKQNLYKVIGLDNFASIEDVRKKYRELALLYHPDRGGKTKDMQILNNVYDIFTKHKKEYDNFLKRLLNPQPIVVQRWSFYYGSTGGTTSTTGWTSNVW